MKSWVQEILSDQIVRLEAFASDAVGSPVEIDTRRLVGRGLYGYVFDLYFRDGRHTGYVLKLTSDWSELLGWSWLQQWNLPGVVSILAVGKGRTEVESPSGMALPTVIVREKVGSWDDYPDSGIARDVSEAIDAWREADGRVLPGDPEPAADLARRLMRIEHARDAGAAIMRLLKSKLILHDLNQQNFGWREDGALVLLDPSVDPMVTRRPKRVPTVLKNPRDPIRESSYPLPIRAALDAWTQSRVKAGAHGRVRWQETTYPWIEEQLAAGHLDDLLAEIAGLIAENNAKAIQRRADRRLDAAQRLWERQAVEVDSWQPRRALRRDLAGRDVWLWHGTSSALLPEIRRRGLLAEPPKKTHQSSTSGYIYLTTESGDYGSGGSAVFYARSAAGKHGGDPVLLRVIVPWNELEPDADDEELSCGRRQFRTARDIAVEQIKEIGDERVGWPEKWPRYRNPPSSALVLADSHAGRNLLMLDPVALKKLASDGSFWNGTCPAGLGLATVSGGRVTRQVARDGWLHGLLAAARSVISGEITALEGQFRAGEDAIEATAAELGVSADEVVGALLEDGEAWGEWVAAGAAL